MTGSVPFAHFSELPDQGYEGFVFPVWLEVVMEDGSTTYLELEPHGGWHRHENGWNHGADIVFTDAGYVFGLLDDLIEKDFFGEVLSYFEGAFGVGAEISFQMLHDGRYVFDCCAPLVDVERKADGSYHIMADVACDVFRDVPSLSSLLDREGVIKMPAWMATERDDAMRDSTFSIAF